MKLSIIIPVYNEQATIGELIRRVCQVKLESAEKEIILVDDGSSDRSVDIIKRQAQDHPELIKVHTSLINLGKGAAIRFGLEYATGDLIIIQDADLELDPNEYQRLIEPILANQTDVVYGSRFLGKAKNIPLKTRLGNAFLTWLTNILYGSRLTDMETSYKVFRRELLDGIKLRCVSFDIEPEITSKFLLKGYKIVEVPISYNPRREDEGKKIRWTDGLDALYILLRCRFLDKSIRSTGAAISSAKKKTLISSLIFIVLGLALCTNLFISLKMSVYQLNFIGNNLSLSYEDKMRLKWPLFFDFTAYVRNNTPADSTVLVPPQKEPPWNMSGNRNLVSYYLYPRTVINGPVETSEDAFRAFLEEHSEIDYVLITSENGVLWPDITPRPTDKANFTIHFYDAGWGIIELSK